MIICVCIHTYIHTIAMYRICIYRYIHMCTHAFLYMYILYIHVFIHIYIYIYRHIVYACVFAYDVKHASICNARMISHGFHDKPCEALLEMSPGVLQEEQGLEGVVIYQRHGVNFSKALWAWYLTAEPPNKDYNTLNRGTLGGRLWQK